MKNIESFTRTMGENWILRVYCDNMYFCGVKPKVIDSVARSEVNLFRHCPTGKLLNLIILRY